MRNLLKPLLLLAALLMLFACTQKNTASEQPPLEKPPTEPLRISHWRYFHTNSDGTIQLQSADAISDIPAVELRPWTEAVRVADCSLNKNGAVFLINKCGLYPVQTLHSDVQLPIRHTLFSQTSAGDLYTVNGSYFIRIYQNTDFLPQQNVENTHFLLRTDSVAGAYTPVADVTHLHIPKEAQCKVLEHINDQWYASFKADTGSEVSFFYLKCNQFDIFTQSDAFNHIDQLSSESFRAACEPASYRQMPDAVKALAETIANDADLYLKLITEDSVHGITFFKPTSIKTTGDQKEKILVNCYALQYTQDGSVHAAILLPDGTLMLNTDKDGITELHLPLLPQNHIYTAFIVSGSQVTAAWEETAFYAVGRTGIFTADLQELSR